MTQTQINKERNKILKDCDKEIKLNLKWIKENNDDYGIIEALNEISAMAMQAIEKLDDLGDRA